VNELTDFQARLQNIADIAQATGAKTELARIINLLSIEMRVQLLGDPDCEPSMKILDIINLIAKGQFDGNRS